MKTKDISKFKGMAMNAVEKWADGMIDKMFPDKPETRTMMKNYASNWLSLQEQNIDQVIEQAFLFLGDKDGNIDSDSVVDMVCGLFDEMQDVDFNFGKFAAKAGKGQVRLEFPDGILSRLMFGDLKGVRITNDDIKEIKKFFNE